MNLKQPYYELSESDEVERMRRVRRGHEERFTSVAEYFDWIANQQRRHDRSMKRSTNQTKRKPRQIRAVSKKA